MQVKAPVKLTLSLNQLVTALLEAGYDIPDSSSIKIELLNNNGYMYYIPLGPTDRTIVSLNWDVEVDVGGPNKCLKESGR